MSKGTKWTKKAQTFDVESNYKLYAFGKVENAAAIFYRIFLFAFIYCNHIAVELQGGKHYWCQPSALPSGFQSIISNTTEWCLRLVTLPFDISTIIMANCQETIHKIIITLLTQIPNCYDHLLRILWVTGGNYHMRVIKIPRLVSPVYPMLKMLICNISCCQLLFTLLIYKHSAKKQDSYLSLSYPWGWETDGISLNSDS